MSRWTRRIAAGCSAVVGVWLIAGCSGDASSDVAVLEAETALAGAPTSADGSGEGDGAAEDATPATDAERWANAFAPAFQSQMDPEPEWTIDGTVITFDFSAGSVDSEPLFHCPVAVSAFGDDYPEWDIVMAYPDGSVSCSEVMNS